MCFSKFAQQLPGYITILLVAMLHVQLVPAHAQARQAVGLELVLLVDASASVDDSEFRLQTDGLASAFSSDAVLSAIRSLADRGIAVCVIQWANQANQRKSIDWTLLYRDTDALLLARKITLMPRQIKGGHTAIGDALLFSLNEIQSSPYEGLRRVIDVSGDGRRNDGRLLSRARKEVLNHGITINGLAIVNELPLLAQYFSDQLIGGPGAFVIVARDYTDIARAMRIKLEHEIRSMPVTKYIRPSRNTRMHASNPVQKVWR